ncbi:MAG: hypothetical protein A2945_03950 [Candidatus Liptonbacteria bacterium RIFCSPLOWO2_01_FULL_52_25]|uniref:NadR/Ttd14 AAA domain-containing protein n=1 Tax=Candidatus Liptonbacteria bacterium RIFCSPLOWO2_01_FULL_52_25 TaxID=1798650 RepID=A0A1G2CCR2_9BACT|nr:MAG: hypothetical protein A2945_03950 [Candidatus Liptonbacteria bacterium RIFCSPLOWO2_01_FULL_52_25]
MDVVSHDRSNERVVLLALTGGVCSGKTETCPWLETKMLDFGWHAYHVPEAARFLIEKFGLPVKVAWQNEDMRLWLRCQEVIAECQYAWEEQRIQIANMIGKFPALVPCDRGLVDIYGYILSACHAFGDPREAFDMFTDVLRRATLRTPREAYRRYVAVVHMVTAADGAPHAYQREDGGARDETLEQAIALDRTILEAWAGHPQRITIDNSTGFKEKQERTLRVICGALGILAPSASDQ